MATDATLTISSHNICFSKMSPYFKKTLLDYCQKLTTFETKKEKYGRTTLIKRNVYAASPMSRSEIRFHINQKEAILNYLKSHGYGKKNIEEIELPLFEGKTVEYPIKDTREPFDYQVEIIKYLIEEGRTKVVTLQTGAGKAQPLYSKLLTPNGWIRMKDVEIGTTLLSSNGDHTKVTGIYPQGVKEIYRITFSDGRTAESTADHLWMVFNPDHGWKVRPLSFIYEGFARNESYRSYIPLVTDINFKERKHVIDPYSLGVILGDGGISHNVITVSTPDKFILKIIKKALPEEMSIKHRNKYDYGLRVDIEQKNPWIQELRRLKLMGKTCYKKFIPNEYKYGTYEQRLSLLQGLMDTDGYADKNGLSEYYTSSKRLAFDVLNLARSLGYWARMQYKKPFYTYKGERLRGKSSYIIGIRSPNPESLFRLPKKKERMNNDNQYAKTLKLAIKRIEKIGEDETQCISVDHPSRLYVTDNYVVTHNTYTALKAISEIKKRLLIVILGRYVNKWIEDVNEAYDLEKGDLLVVRGSKDLLKLMHHALMGELKAKIIICTSTTFQRYIKDWEYGNQYGFLIPPSQFMEKLDIGTRLIDETHQFFHLNFKMDLYTHINRSIYLSATLEPSDKFLKRMYEVIYPPELRMKGKENDRYIDVIGLSYRIEGSNRVRCKRNGVYSHTAYENELIKNNSLLNSYLELIYEIVKEGFINKKQEGQKMLIFASTIRMCMYIRDYLIDMIPDQSIVKYTAEDSWDELHNNDIVVSTMGSAGTAVDIADLKTCLNTVSVSSIQQNIQALGRLRKLVRYKDDNPEYIYIYSPDIERQKAYHMAKFDMFKDLCRSHNSYDTKHSLDFSNHR